MNVTIEGSHGLYLAGQAHIVGDDSREFAWAEKHVYKDRDLKWVLGNYVQADKANSNGHIFPLEDLKGEAQKTVANKPLNMLHQARRIVGHYVAVEMLFPTAGEGAASTVDVPYMEALSAYYHYYFPEEYKAVELAHADGALFYSMECVPSSLICAHEECGQEFAYAGRQDESYCAHLQEVCAPRRLVKPHFTGGALIIPPVNPGWKQADIKELSWLIERDIEQAESVYEEVKAATPHLGPQEWEAAMLMLMEQARDIPGAERQKMAKTGAAMPDGSFPIANTMDLKNAIQSIGRAKNPAAAKAHIKKRAKALGAEQMIPEGW